MPENVPVLVPPLRLKATVFPPVVIRFPAASFEVSVAVTVEPEPTLGLETVIKEVTVDTAPVVTVTVGSELVIPTP